MKIVISAKAEKQIKKLSTVNQIILIRKIRKLSTSFDLNSQNIKKLKGYKNIFRLRVGDMRVVFKSKAQELYIICIGHRKDIYKIFKG